MRAVRRIAIGALAVVLAFAGLLLGPVKTASADSTDVPGQYIAKLYTEALGRLPSPAEWRSATQTFADAGCSASTLAEVGQQVYTSADYAGLGYDNVAKLSTLYRGAQNSEADAAGVSQWRSQLEHGESWSTVVARFFVDDAFTSLVPKICSGARDSSATSYGWSSAAPSSLPSDSAGFNSSQDQLQKILDDAPAGSTVQLAERALVTITEPLTVPKQVTLTTVGDPSTSHYADMGRLVRGGDFNGPVVQVADGGRLTAVWVDGGRANAGDGHPSRVGVRVLGGQHTRVVGNKISNTAGTAAIQVYGQAAGYPCSDVAVRGNVITAYSNDHYLVRQLDDGQSAGMWTDGITVACGDTSVTGNQIVDTGGVGIALRPASASADAAVAQHSRVSANTIVSAGVPMYAAITADPQFYVPGTSQAQRYDFEGARLRNNRLWSSPGTHFVIGISVGTRAWYAGAAMVGANSGSGVAVTGNQTAGVGARVRTGIAISGMDDVALGSDPADWRHDQVRGKTGNSCPDAAVVAAVSAGSADGLETEASYRDAGVDGCMGEP